MSVLIDDVFTEFENPEREAGVEEQNSSEPAGPSESDAEQKLRDTIRRIEQRQLRLMAD